MVGVMAMVVVVVVVVVVVLMVVVVVVMVWSWQYVGDSAAGVGLCRQAASPDLWTTTTHTVYPHRQHFVIPLPHHQALQECEALDLQDHNDNDVKVAAEMLDKIKDEFDGGFF